MIKDTLDALIEGHIKIWDPDSGEVFVNKRNAVNFENISIAIANLLAGNFTQGFYVSEMHFGNGGTVIDSTGAVSYRPPNVNGQGEQLYNATFFKVVDEEDFVNNTDPGLNKTSITHVNGLNYTDLVVTCTIDYSEPVAEDSTFNLAGTSQDAQDNATNMEGSFVFDELGLKIKSTTGSLGDGLLITHVIFHPVQKSANRLLQVIYTLRIRAG
jgi:hypothetical protein